MSDNIAKTKDGRDSFVSVRLPAWHEKGIVLPDYVTAKQMLEMSGGNYKVVKAAIPQPNGKEQKEFFYLYREDTGEILGTSGRVYTVVQNEDGFSILDVLTGEGEAKYETAMCLGKGEQFVVTCKVPEDMTIGGEKYTGYFVVKNSHDGRGALKILCTPIRVVCQNTLNAALANHKRSFSIWHTPSWEEQVAQAKESMQLVRAYNKSFVEVAEDLLRQRFTEAQFADLIDVIKNKPEDDASAKAKTIYERDREQLFESYNADDLNDIRDTKWGAYNAVAAWADHFRESRGVNAADNRYLRTFEETIAKDKAFAYLTK